MNQTSNSNGQEDRSEYIQDLVEEFLELIDQAMTAGMAPYLTHREVYQALDTVRKEIGRIHDPSDHQQAIIKEMREAEIAGAYGNLDAMVEEHMESFTDRDCIELWETEYKNKREKERKEKANE